MKYASQMLCALLMVAAYSQARAQEENVGGIAPLPAMDVIKPATASDDAILTTRDKKPENSPFSAMEGNEKKTNIDATTPPVGGYSPKIPFGKAEPAAPIIPEGPHATVAVPVVDVDTLDAPEAAPPEPIEEGADPVQENPAEPTELTSPIFEAEEGPMGTRSVVIRALNKVTAQSETMTLKSNQMAKFGQLQITAVTCQVSAARSQTDYAALLDIVEKLPTGDGTKPVFRGWMYASSPSIAALEHPVYDVTMVECKTMPRGTKVVKPVEVKDEKEAPKASETKQKKSTDKPKQ